MFLLIFIVAAIGLIGLAKIGTDYIIGSQTKPTAQGLKDYNLVFHDEFNGKQLDASRWGTCYDWYDQAHAGCTNFGNDELQWYKRNQVGVANGILELTATKQNAPGATKGNQPKTYPYVSGMVSTGSAGTNKPRWMHTYGYYEARINAPSGQGIWPAFWLLPTGTKWPPEIDIMEILGHHPTQVLTTYFWNDTPNHVAKDSYTYNSFSNMTGSWHTYGINWQPGRLDWYIDGQRIHGVSGKYVPSEPMSIVLNLAVGGKLPGYPDDTTHFPAIMQVDYVRVFQR